MLIVCAIALILLPPAWADTDPRPEKVAYEDNFDDGAMKWRPQGEGFKASVLREDDGNGLLQLDNSAGEAIAYVGIRAGEPGEFLSFSLAARTVSGQPGQVGLHRYQDGTHWGEINGQWSTVEWMAAAHDTSPHWYIAVPAGAVVQVDNVSILRVALTEEDRARKLADMRAQSAESAVETYRKLEHVRPADGTALSIGGEFPVGFYTVRTTSDRDIKLDGIFAELAACGANIVHNSDFEDWPEHTPYYDRLNSDAAAQKYLDLAGQHGLKVVMGFDRSMVIKSDLAGLQRRAKALADHAALAGWYLIDEPSLQGTTPEATLLAYETVREADPNHPITAALCNARTFTDFAPSLDVIISDVYPVSTNVLFALVPNIEKALAVTRGAKPIWSAVQVNNMDMHRVRYGGLGPLLTNPRLPTPDEVRAMTYLSIAHGASGIMFYAYDWFLGRIYQDEELYKGVRELVREIVGHSELLLCDVLAKGAVEGQDGRLVSYIVRGKPGGGALLIAVNGFDGPSGPVTLTLNAGQEITVDLAANEALVRKLQ